VTPADHKDFVTREGRAAFHWIRATMSPSPSAP
jgi:hypothetical protein